MQNVKQTMQENQSDLERCCPRPPGCDCPCQSGSVRGWTREHAGARAARCCGRCNPDGSETPSDCHPDGPHRTNSCQGTNTHAHYVFKAQHMIQQREGRRGRSGSVVNRRLPVPGLDAQPLIITILVGPEADARKPRERFQPTNNDVPLTGG